MKWQILNENNDYEVSNTGLIRSLKSGKKKLLVLFPKWDGYLRVSLMRNSKLKQKAVHRIVAENFIPNPKNLPFVNHKDHNKLNNNVDNLEWCTGRDNVTHSVIFRTGKTSTGVTRDGNRFLTSIVFESRRIHIGTFKTDKEARNAYQVALEVYNSSGILGVEELVKKYYYKRVDLSGSKYYGVSQTNEIGRRQRWLANIKKRGCKKITKRFYTEIQAIEFLIGKYTELGLPLHFSHEDYLKNKTYDIQKQY